MEKYKDLEIGTPVKHIKDADGLSTEATIGQEGTVVGFNTNGATGNTNSDPLIQVKFKTGYTDSYWYEELEKV